MRLGGHETKWRPKPKSVVNEFVGRCIPAQTHERLEAQHIGQTYPHTQTQTQTQTATQTQSHAQTETHAMLRKCNPLRIAYVLSIDMHVQPLPEGLYESNATICINIYQ